MKFPNLRDAGVQNGKVNKVSDSNIGKDVGIKESEGRVLIQVEVFTASWPIRASWKA